MTDSMQLLAVTKGHLVQHEIFISHSCLSVSAVGMKGMEQQEEAGSECENTQRKLRLDLFQSMLLQGS